jgi:hypothetical protein
MKEERSVDVAIKGAGSRDVLTKINSSRSK